MDSRPTIEKSVVESADSGIESADSTAAYPSNPLRIGPWVRALRSYPLAHTHTPILMYNRPILTYNRPVIAAKSADYGADSYQTSTFYFLVTYTYVLFTTRPPAVTDIFYSGRNVGALRQARSVHFRYLALCQQTTFSIACSSSAIEVSKSIVL